MKIILDLNQNNVKSKSIYLGMFENKKKDLEQKIFKAMIYGKTLDLNQNNFRPKKLDFDENNNLKSKIVLDLKRNSFRLIKTILYLNQCKNRPKPKQC